ncbi:ChaN family lipoprotein [Zoogloea sp.]|uniref:ChaN family lipoprotein n=1 Tax=Zoogloea sp. TaxID=49181 RepID=UPI0014168770|nr:MAG: ChaN family lipoprotein [Zoogloea sp.]
MRALLFLALLISALPSPLHAADILDTATDSRLTIADLLRLARQADFVLLGEIHDNPHHHRLRAEFIARLAPGSVVVEHLEQGHQTRWRDASGTGRSVADALTEAGFDRAGWQWPIHAPLFDGLARAGIPATGGNIGRELARRIVREGPGALPPALAAPLAGAPLQAAAEAALEADLLDSHCGQLPPGRVPGMRLAQRARDAAMATALLATPGKPAVLLAGNGHVRGDYGVPVLLAGLRPGARILSIGFVEDDRPGDDEHLYTHVWRTSPASRDDPCTAMRANRPKG